MKYFSLLILFLACLITAPATAQNRGFGDLVAGPFDVQTPVADIFNFGVEHAWGHYWITALGTGEPGTQQIHKYLESGTWVASYPQRVSASQSSGFGGMDMEADESANLLFVGNWCGRLLAAARLILHSESAM